MKVNNLTDPPALKIKQSYIQSWMTPELLSVKEALEQYNFEVRIVGGAIRDILLGKEPRDIDLATDALPDQIIWVMAQHGFDMKLKGITHGTVKVIFPDDQEFEISSLDFKIKDVNGKLKISHHASWAKDAKRRDFTINTMSMDFDGNVYDYVGGIDDLKHQRIVFLGNPAQRIQNEPVLILRFFKLFSKFKAPQYDDRILTVIKKNKDVLSQIKPERQDLELSNIEKGINARYTAVLMCKLGLSDIIPVPCLN